MSIEKLEAEALKLDRNALARLTGKLLESLEDLSEKENEELWVQEAERRHADLSANPASGQSAETVFREARGKLR